VAATNKIVNCTDCVIGNSIEETVRCATVYGYMYAEVQYRCLGYKGIRFSKTVNLQLHMIRYGMIYCLSAIGLTAGGSSTVHSYRERVNRTTQ